MASIKDSIEEIMNEDRSLIKLLVYAIPIYFTYFLFSIGNVGLGYLVGFLVVIMLLTIFTKAFYNVRCENNLVLPDLNIFSYIFSSTKTLFAICPIFLVCFWITKILLRIEIPIPLDNIQLIYSIIVYAIMTSIVLTSMINYAKTENIKDAYNLKVISDTCIDILIAFVIYLPQLIVVNALVLGVIAYLFGILWYLLNPIFIFLCSIAVVFDVAVTGHYLAQIDYENFTREDQN